MANEAVINVAAILVTARPSGDGPDEAAMTKIDGRESAMRALELMTNREPITQVMLVVDTSAAEEVKRKLGSHLMFMGIKLVQATGGWYAHLNAALPKLADGITHVLVHDAARPAVPYTDLEAILGTAGSAIALASPVRGLIARANTVPGEGMIEPLKIAQVLTPRLYERATFQKLCNDGREPSSLLLIEGSPLNLRCGESSPGLIKAVLQLLPKPKVNAPTNPFEEAQW